MLLLQVNKSEQHPLSASPAPLRFPLGRRRIRHSASPVGWFPRALQPPSQAALANISNIPDRRACSTIANLRIRKRIGLSARSSKVVRRRAPGDLTITLPFGKLMVCSDRTGTISADVPTECRVPANAQALSGTSTTRRLGVKVKSVFKADECHDPNTISLTSDVESRTKTCRNYAAGRIL